MVEGISRSQTPPPSQPAPEAPKSENKGPDAGDQAQRAAQDAQRTAQEAQQQAQQDQAKEAVKQSMGEIQDAQAATRADLLQQIQKTKEKLQTQINEFVQVVETVLQEGMEGFRIPTTDQGAGVFQDHGQTFTPKEQQMVREFLRQLKHLMGEQGLEFSHALNHLKTQQGGEFWKQFSQILQKGLPPGVQTMTPEQLVAKLKAAGQLGGEAMGEKDVLKGELGRGPGAVLSEIIRAETNPTIHTEAMLAALALLKQEGMERSHRELVQYLRQRWKMGGREMQRFLQQYPVTYYYQGPTPQQRFKDLNTPWYPLIALGTIPIARLLGLDWSMALFMGILLTAVLFLVTYLSREKE
jgi:hypothetical protein